MKNVKTKKTKAVKSSKMARLGKMLAAGSAMTLMSFGMMPATAFADPIAVTETNLGDATNLMGNVIGILLTITRFVGIALVVYGVYEIVMSFMQNQPEAKTKGIIMALAGIVMTVLKSVLVGIGIVAP